MDNCDGAVTHLEPNILECEENGALGSTTMKKASGISAEVFQIHGLFMSMYGKNHYNIVK